MKWQNFATNIPYIDMSKIIDFHTHAFPDKIAKATMQKLGEISKIPYYTDGTWSGLEEAICKAGVDMAVVLNIATRPGQENTINTVAAEKSRGRFIAFGSVHPDSPDAIEQLEKIKELGIRGVKFHPDYQNFMIDDKKMWPIYRKVSELGLIAVFHAGFDPLSPELIHAMPQASAKVVESFPDMVTVLAHLGGMYKFDEVEKYLACGYKNLYIDTAMAYENIKQEQLLRIIDSFGAEHVLYGSDNPWHDSAFELSLIRSLPICERDKKLILGENAARLLNI